MKQMAIRALSLLLVSILVLGMGVFSSAALQGDVNNDGQITIFDALMILKASTNGTNLSNSDLNGDGRTTLLDVIRVLKLISTGEVPELNEKDESTKEVVVENGVVKEAVSINGEKVSAAVPEGVAVNEGVDALTLSVTALDNNSGNITASEDEETITYDVHVEGVSTSNDVAIIVDLGAILEQGQNFGNVTLYHIENGETVKMTQVMTLAELDAHNEFYYNPESGNVYVALATFSQVVAVANTVNAWNGVYDTTWYNTADTSFKIANADQLAGFAQIVGGMAEGIEADTFEGKTVTLLADINLGDDEANNNPDIIFYPIGYYNSTGKYDRVTGETVSSGYKAFKGTFDGMGHTIANFYQNTWEMFGDYNDGYSGTPNYSRDGMGLFGKVYGGTVKNLTVENFSSDGEYATTGVIAAYADSDTDKSATFENIAIVNCNPRVYNIGNGGIVGCAGWYSKNTATEKPVIFRNITVDNTNKISALWGSYDVSCGGILGQYYPDSGCGISFENCHIAAQLDVYNDVCANYQYYWYRYSGMFIGTIRDNVTENGYTVANTADITATNCTYTYGNWNEYWYCELVKNSLASYTHDHQFSRLTKIASVSEIQDASGNWNTEGNFVIPNADNTAAECYHIFKNSNGELYQHFHNVADESNPEIYETFDLNGDGELKDLKEDRTCYYIPFGQVFNGLGYGVKPTYTYKDFTLVENGPTKSEYKFASKNDAVTSYTPGETIKLGDLFEAIVDETKISKSSVYVSVTPATETGTASATYAVDLGNWENGTLTFAEDSKEAATVIITDYFYCTPTVITLESANAEPEATQKFNLVFENTAKYLYRVGNGNAVALSYLFSAADNASIGTVNVTVEAVDGLAVSGTYTPGTPWTSGTLKFSGTGVVKVTITDDYCIPTVLYLEVVDAKNITSATGTTTGGDFVLLCDINTSKYINYWNCTLYGNGFTYSLNGAPTNYDSKQGHGVLIAKNATFDNIAIIGDIYDKYGVYSNQDDYNAAIDATESTFKNCYIANCSTPIRAIGVTLINSTLYGGTVANLLISGGVNTLENVTTVNYNDGRGILGYGIVISDGASENVKMILNGELKQHNFVCSADKSAIPDQTALTLFSRMFESKYSDYHLNYNGTTYVNTGILSMVATFDESDITNNTGNGYVGSTVDYNGTKGYLYSIPASENSVDNNYNEATDPHKSAVQGDYLPTFTFDLGDQEISNEGADDTRYLTGNARGVEALYQNNESPVSLDLTKLASAYKYDGTNYTVSASYKDINGTVLGTDTTVSLTDSGTLEFAVTDNIFYGVNGEKLNKSVTRIYKIPVTVSVKQAAIKNATIKFSSNSITGNYEKKTGTFGTTEGYYLSFNLFKNLTVTDYDADGTAETVNLNANIISTEYEYVVANNAWNGVTIKITYALNDVGDSNRVLTFTLGTPEDLNSPSPANGGKAITMNNGTIKSSGFVGKSSTGTWPITYFSFKGNNGSTVEYNSNSNSNITVKFTEVSSGGGGGCVTPDTLVTLADGTQKRMDEVTYTDLLLVWDFFNGEYTTTTAAIIDNHGFDNYTITTVNFANGASVNTINGHGFFDVDINRFVLLDENNVADYVGHTFLVQNADGFVETTLESYSVKEEHVESWSILTAEYHNCILNGMLTLTPGQIDGSPEYLMPFAVGDDMKYDAEAMAADVAEYGLYTYEDFAHVITPEQFNALNLQYFKVAVGKGAITYNQIIYLLNLHMN